VLAKPLAACTHLSWTVSQFFELQVQKNAVFTYRSSHFSCRALVHINAYQCAKFNFLALLVSEIKRVSQNLMWGYYPSAIPGTLKLLCVLKVLGKVKQRAKFQHRISMHHSVMRICIFHRLSITCAQKWGFWGVLRKKMWKYCLLTPKRLYPSWIRVCWVVTLAIWGEVTHGATLTKCRLWGDIVDVITCAIFGDFQFQLRVWVGVVRGVSLPSPTDLTRRRYNTDLKKNWFRAQIPHC